MLSRDTQPKRRAASRRSAVEPGLSEAEFAARFEEARPLLRAIAGAVLGSPANVDDAVQEAALIGLRKLDSFDPESSPESSFVAWMGQIVRFVALNAGRRRARRADRDSLALAQKAPAAEPPPEPARFDHSGKFDVDESPFDDRVLEALNTLEETARICLLLRALHDLPYRRIARILDIPEGTAMSHVHRARRTMRALLAGDTESIDE